MNNVKLGTYPEEKSRFGASDVSGFFQWCSENLISDITISTNDYIWGSHFGNMLHLTKRKLTIPEVMDVLVKVYDSEAVKGIIQQGKDADFSYTVRRNREQSYRFRVNATPGYGAGDTGLQITARIIQDEPAHLKELKIEPEICENLYSKEGLVLVTGPTGSGKTTLLSAIMRYFCEQPFGNHKIITYEAPIEFVYDNVERPSTSIFQTEIGIGRQLQSWPDAIRNALRRAPTIILLGESRDIETISQTIIASTTGHLVYTTLHTDSFANTINRMVNMFPADQQEAKALDILSTLKMTVAQKLVKSTDGKRVALREFVVFNDEVRNIFLRSGHKRIPITAREVLKDYGRSFVEDGLIKLKEEKISPTVFWRDVAQNLSKEEKAEINKKLKAPRAYSLPDQSNKKSELFEQSNQENISNSNESKQENPFDSFLDDLDGED